MSDLGSSPTAGRRGRREQPGDGNATLVEFTLSPDGEGTRLRMVESGFAELAMPEEDRRARHEQNGAGWTRKLAELQQHTEQLPV